MSLTVTNRPVGHKLDTTDHSATIVDDGTGTARVYTGTAHGLADGDYVYIESNFERYNGYKYVDSTAYDYFKIKNAEGDAAIEYIQDADIIFYISVLDHGYQCVHLPIIYELESSVYPVNQDEEAYVPRTIVSAVENNGNTQLNLSSALDSDIEILEWLELVGDDVLAGPYEIISVLQPWSVVINLAWDAGNIFTGYTVVNYYNNYFVRVQVYAGLNPSHRWADQKTYELAADLKLIPDENNRLKFSISEILKGYIETRNNLTLDTLPNNLDFYVQFYIRYNENWNESDNAGGITLRQEPFVSDQENFEGHALNAMLPFKSQNAGHMSEYINEATYLSRWLTLQDMPLMIIGRFFDLSFIMTVNGTDVLITIFKSLNGIVTETEVITIVNPGTGIIRVPITPESGFDMYCLQASTAGTPGTPAITSSITPPARSTWVNIAGTGVDWTTGSSPSVILGGATLVSDLLAGLYAFIEGYTYSLSYTLTSSDPWANTTFTLYVLDSLNNILLSSTKFINSGGAGSSKTEIHTFVAPVGAAKMAIKINRSIGTTSTYTFTQILGEQTTIEIPAIPAENITEQICCNVREECDGTFVNDDLRLLEGGQFRELE